MNIGHVHRSIVANKPKEAEKTLSSMRKIAPAI